MFPRPSLPDTADHSDVVIAARIDHPVFPPPRMRAIAQHCAEGIVGLALGPDPDADHDIFLTDEEFYFLRSVPRDTSGPDAFVLRRIFHELDSVYRIREENRNGWFTAHFLRLPSHAAPARNFPLGRLCRRCQAIAMEDTAVLSLTGRQIGVLVRYLVHVYRFESPAVNRALNRIPFGVTLPEPRLAKAG